MLLTGIALGSAAGCAAGLIWCRWLHERCSRTRDSAPGAYARLSWVVVPLAALGGGLAMLAPGTLRWALWVYLVVGAVLVWTDLNAHRIPNAITRWSAPALALAVIAAAIADGRWQYVGASAIGAVVVGVSFLALALTSSVGMGDVKLAALTGWVVGPLGPALLVLAIGAGVTLTAAAGLVLLVRGRGRRSEIALAPGLVAGVGIAVVWSVLAPAR